MHNSFKTCEKLKQNQMYGYINSFLSPKLYCSKRSFITQFVLLSLPKSCANGFRAFDKAFDTINYNLLMVKPRTHGLVT